MVQSKSKAFRNVSIDLGSSSVRMTLNVLCDSVVKSSLFHQFKTHKILNDNEIFWDYKKIFQGIMDGLKKLDISIDTIGIDGWGVDYALLDCDNNIIDNVYTYRSDSVEDVWDYFEEHNFFKTTGILNDKINTTTQLKRDSVHRQQELSKAKHILLMADVFNFLLTGNVANSRALASTSQLISFNDTDINTTIKNKLGIDNIKMNILEDGTNLGHIKEGLLKELHIGNPSVILVPGHDTACALATLKMKKGDMFMITGSWVLAGTQLSKPIISEKVENAKLTNEQAAFQKIKLLKNINGLFLIQQLKKCWDEDIDFSDIVQAAKESYSFKSSFNPNADEFMHNSNIVDAIIKHCINTKQEVPNKLGEFAQTIYNSLINEYKSVKDEIESITGHEIKRIHICGGGIKDTQLLINIRDKLKVKIVIGEVEASSLGNSLLQYHYTNVISKEEMHKIGVI